MNKPFVLKTQFEIASLHDSKTNELKGAWVPPSGYLWDRDYSYWNDDVKESDILDYLAELAIDCG